MPEAFVCKNARDLRRQHAGINARNDRHGVLGIIDDLFYVVLELLLAAAQLGKVEEAYQEVARRLGLLPEEGDDSAVLDLDSHRKKRGK